MCLIASGIQRIDMNKGNLFTEDILNQELCCYILKDNILERNDILNVIMYASEETQKEFELPNFNYSLLEDYITDTYDYFVSQKKRIQQNKSISTGKKEQSV